jgi:hypothetical protein
MLNDAEKREQLLEERELKEQLDGKSDSAQNEKQNDTSFEQSFPTAIIFDQVYEEIGEYHLQGASTLKTRLLQARNSLISFSRLSSLPLFLPLRLSSGTFGSSIFRHAQGTI